MRHVRARIALLVCVLFVLTGSAFARRGPEDVALTGELELARLLDLCADRLEIPVEYDRKLLAGMTVTLRQAVPVPADRLWDLANQRLARHDLTTIQLPGDTQVILSW